MSAGAPLRAPFPYFGGKSRAAHLVWAALGDVANYVEPFFGSGAVLLARPHAPRIETVNDRSRFLANFWRAVKADPDAVAEHADWPVNESDLHARHRWLVAQLPGEFGARMDTDPEFFDARIAGWWAGGQCSWIGTGWCREVRERGDGPPRGQSLPIQLPHVGDAGMGLHKKLPHVGNAGRGLHKKLPHVGDAGRGSLVVTWLRALSDRLRCVRVACGDWTRVTGESVTVRHGTTGMFLDPPYDDGAVEYSAGGAGISADVRAWAIANGANPRLRIVLCGYEGEHAMPASWRSVAWKAKGGYGSQRKDGTNENSGRERLWLSPHCLSEHGALFDRAGVADAR